MPWHLSSNVGFGESEVTSYWVLRVTLVNDSSQNPPSLPFGDCYPAQKTLRNFCFSEEKESFKVEFEKEGDSLSQRKRALKALGDGPQLPPLPSETYQVATES